VTGVQTCALPIFSNWDVNQPIPEAGCQYNPDGSGNNEYPNPLNYYKLVITGQGFTNITSLNNLEPGDLLIYANNTQGSKKKDTGHIMLITAVADSDDGSKLVVVIDETGSPHSDDTRSENTEPSVGLGMGIAKLAYDGDRLQFYWRSDSRRPQRGAIALGRAK